MASFAVILAAFKSLFNAANDIDSGAGAEQYVLNIKKLKIKM